MNCGRLIPGGGSLLRRLCTASPVSTVAELPNKKYNLYQRLSELEKTGGTVSQTLNQYIMEGKAVGKGELDKCVQELRKYRRIHHAFEVSQFFIIFPLNFDSYQDLSSQSIDSAKVISFLCKKNNFSFVSAFI